VAVDVRPAALATYFIDASGKRYRIHDRELADA
jgi:hypothetical protein